MKKMNFKRIAAWLLILLMAVSSSGVTTLAEEVVELSVLSGTASEGEEQAAETDPVELVLTDTENADAAEDTTADEAAAEDTTLDEAAAEDTSASGDTAASEETAEDSAVPEDAAENTAVLEDAATGIVVTIDSSILPEDISLNDITLIVSGLSGDEQTALLGETYALCSLKGYRITLKNSATGKKIEKLNGVEIAIPVPQSYSNSLAVLHLEDDDLQQEEFAAEKLPFTVETEQQADGTEKRTITLTTGRFDLFALVDADSASTAVEEGTVESVDSAADSILIDGEAAEAADTAAEEQPADDAAKTDDSAAAVSADETVQSLIEELAALPDAGTVSDLSKEEQEAMIEKIRDLLDRYAALTEEQQEAINTTASDALLNAQDALSILDPGYEDVDAEEDGFGLMLMAAGEKTAVSFTLNYDGKTILQGDDLTSHYMVGSVTFDDGSVEPEDTTVTSPNYPNNYPNSCAESKDYWEVSCPGAKSMTITFSDDSKTESVSFDWVAVYDKNGKQCGKYGGTTFGGTSLTVSGDYVKIAFRSDGSVTANGFSAAVHPNGAYAITLEPETAPTELGTYTAVATLDGTDLTETITYTVEELHWEIGSPTASDVVATLSAGGVLTVSGTGNTGSFSIPAEYRDMVKKLVVEDGVTSINGLCRSCTNLTEVTLPESLTSIGNNTFNDCNALTTVSGGEGLTSIGNSAFKNCTTLESIDIPDSVASIEASAFENCSSLESINIPDSLTAIATSTFKNCEKLDGIEIPSGVTSIGDAAFSGCKALTEIEIPETVSSLGSYVFANCSGLESVQIDNDDMALGVGDFRDCTKLKEINLPANLTAIPGLLFEDCYALEEVEVPDSVQSIGSSAFHNCTSLKDVNIPEGVQTIESSTFYGCSSLTEVDIPSSVTSIGPSAFYSCTDLEKADIPSGVTSIGSSAFSNCRSLKEADIPSGVTAIKNNTFSNCTSLTDVTISAGVTSIESQAFYGDITLTDVDIPDGVTSIGRQAFYNCDSLEEVTIPDSVTTIGNEAFTYSDSLKEVTIGSGVTSMGSNVFDYCPQLYKATIKNTQLTANEFKGTVLSELTLDADLTSVDPTALTSNGKELAVTVTKDVSTIPESFFTALSTRDNTSITFEGENVIDLNGISAAGLGTPYDSLKDGKYYVDAAGSLYYLDEDTHTAELAVAAADSDTSFTVPAAVNGDYTVTGVGSNAFYLDDDVESVTFDEPENITSIAVAAFLNRTKLTSINGLNDTEEIKELFADSVTIGMEAYQNTGLTVTKPYTETKGTITLRDSDGKGPTVYITSSTESTLNTDPNKFNMYTGETQKVTVSISNNDNTVSGEKIRVYLQFDNADGGISYTEKEWTIKGESGQTYKLVITKDQSNRYCLEFEQPALGDTVNFEFTATYPSPTSAGGDVLVWGDVVKADEAETFMTNPTTVQRGSWTTQADDWTLSKTPYDKNNAKLYSSAELGNTAYLRGLQYQYTLTRDGETLEGVGKDYMQYVEFTDILTLPEGYSLNPDIVDEINAGNLYLATGSSKPASEGEYMYYCIYCKVDGKAYNIASLYGLGPVSWSPAPPIDTVHYDAEVIDESHIKVVWRIYNSDLSTEISNITSSYYRIHYGWWLIQCDITEIVENTTSDFVNSITADQTFAYSENQLDTAEATIPFNTGSAKMEVDKTVSGTSYQSGRLNYILKAKNTGAYPYLDYGRMTDTMPKDYFIAPDDIESMFDETAFGYDALTLTILNATLCTPLANETVTRSNGSTATLSQQQLQGANTEAEDSVQSLYSAKQSKDENQQTNNASITMTRNEEGLIAVTVSDGRTFTVGADGTLEEIFNRIGFMVTSEAQYQCVWDHDNADHHFIIYGDETLTYEIPATTKSTFMLINEDTPYQGTSSGRATYNYCYAYSATNPDTRIDYDYAGYYRYNEFTTTGSISVNGERVEEGENVSDNTVLDQTIRVTHEYSSSYPGIDYSVTPVVKELSGAQVVMAEVADNPSLADKGLTVITKAGVSYYLLNQAGEYHNVSLNGSIADTVVVEDSASGKDTVIKWYEDLNGVTTLNKSFKTYLSRNESGIGDSAFYSISGMSWLGDHEAHRLYVVDPGIAGSVVTFDKNIVTNPTESTGPETDELAQHSLVEEGDSVTYRLDLSYFYVTDEEEEETHTATLYGYDIQDALPGSIADYLWTKGVSVSLRYQEADNVTVTNPDSWDISYVDRNGVDHTEDGQQYIRWADDFAITFSDTAYIYVTLTFPSSDTWYSYLQRYGAETLVNTFYLHDLFEEVTHELNAKTEAYLNKGVMDAGWKRDTFYFSSNDTTSRRVYGTNDAYQRVIQYYGTIYNAGDTRLYLSTLYDVLPEGFTYLGLANNGNSSVMGCIQNGYTFYYGVMSGTIYNSSSSVVNAVTISDAERSSVKYKSAVISSANAGTTPDGRNIVTFNLTGNRTQSSFISYDEARDMYYLSPGEAVVFGYLVNPGDYDAALPNVRTNGLMMQFYDYTGSGLEISDTPVTAKQYSGKDSNDGTCEEKSGMEVNAAYGIPVTYASTWLYSDVSMNTGEIMPGITKSAVSATTASGGTKTNFASVEPTDKVNWQLLSENSGEKQINNYSISDVMPYPYEFEGTVSLVIKDNLDKEMVNTTLFTIAERHADDTEVTITYPTGTSSTGTATVPLDGTPTDVTIGYYAWNNTSTGYYTSKSWVTSTITVVMKKDADGNSVMTVTMPDKTLGIPEGGSAAMNITTTNPHGLLECKVYTNRCYITPLSQTFDHNAVDRGNYTQFEDKDSVRNSAMLTVAYGYISSAVKAVTEISNPGNTAKSNEEKNYITLSSATSQFRYTLTVDNSTHKAMTRLVFIDNLPEIGDVGTFAGSDERETAFKVDFADDLNLAVVVYNSDRTSSTTLTADQYTVEFSDVSSGFSDDDWKGTTTWDAAKSDSSRSLRIMIFDDTGTLVPADYHVAVSFNAKVDMDQYDETHLQEDDAGKIAWNSFGYSYRRLGDTYDLEAAPDKVGVQFQCYPYLQKKLVDASGDYVDEEDKTFTFIIHNGEALPNYTDNAEIAASGRDFALVQLTVPAGSSVSDALLLKPSALKTVTWDADSRQWVEDGGTFTWVEEEAYTIAEINIPYDVESTVFSGHTGTSATFTYTDTNKTTYVCTNTLRTGKITLKKLDTDGTTPLADVVFELTDENGVSVQKTTDPEGKVVFKDLPDGIYTITEVSTQEGRTLLSEPIVVTLPLGLTEEEISEKEEVLGVTIDRTKAAFDPETEKYYFYELSYEVTNSTNLVLPMTGVTDSWKLVIRLLIVLAMLDVLAIIYVGRRNSNRRKAA